MKLAVAQLVALMFRQPCAACGLDLSAGIALTMTARVAAG